MKFLWSEIIIISLVFYAAHSKPIHEDDEFSNISEPEIPKAEDLFEGDIVLIYQHSLISYITIKLITL